MDWETILSAGVVAALVSSSLNFGFQYFFERRKSKEKVLSEIKENDKTIIKELYGPIKIIMEDNIVPGDGYEGLDAYQLTNIRKVIDINPHLVDSVLDNMTYSFLEELIYLGIPNIDFPPDEKICDLDRKFFYHVLEVYNRKKKNLHLPYDEDYLSVKKKAPNG